VGIGSTNAIVLDAEPLVAHVADERGATVTEQYLEAVSADEIEGYLTRINATEVRYVLARRYDLGRADRYLRWLSEIGVTPVGAEELWRAAADRVLSHNPSLADAYALAAAEITGASLLTGGDDDFEEVEAVSVERIRDQGV